MGHLGAGVCGGRTMAGIFKFHPKMLDFFIQNKWNIIRYVNKSHFLLEIERNLNVDESFIHVDKILADLAGKNTQLLDKIYWKFRP